MIELYHCVDARSFRALWTLEELGLPYTLHVLPFPPRMHCPDYCDINPLGTVPLLLDDKIRMTESVAICHYLCQRHGPTPLLVTPDEPAFAEFLNWCDFGEATLTFPQTLVLRYSRLEPVERRQPQVAQDYTRWFLARLRAVEAALENRDFLCAGRLTLADISVGYALLLAGTLDLASAFHDRTAAYWSRLQQLPGFQRAKRAQARAAHIAGLNPDSYI